MLQTAACALRTSFASTVADLLSEAMTGLVDQGSTFVLRKEIVYLQRHVLDSMSVADARNAGRRDQEDIGPFVDQLEP